MKTYKKYGTNDTPKLDIFNGSTKKIDPREDALSIIIKSNGATGKEVTLRNLSTGDTWKYAKNFNSGDVIRLEGTKMTCNNVSIVNKTNLELISLQEGLNTLSVEGISGAFEVTVQF